MVRLLSARSRELESALALAACLVAAVLASWSLLRPHVYSADAFVHQYWMWQWRDGGLFHDPLTAELRESARYPGGYQALFWLASQAVDPIAFGEWLGVGLMAVSGWLIFLIVREHTPWRPAAWIGAALFLALVDIHRFHGGFPRAFVHPVVLLTVLLAMRRQHLAAALVAAAGALLYPPAALLALGVLIVSAVHWGRWPPRLDRRRAAFAALALALAAVAVVGPDLVFGGAPRVLTAAEARAFPEFGEHGALHFFASSPAEYLRQNRSGFDLRASGGLLALAALALLLVRPANLRLLRPEVLALPVVSLAGFALAQAVLFRLYLPHRYTYPLVAFFAIVVAVTLRPTWAALWGRPRPRLRAFALLSAPLALAALAIVVFPVSPRAALDRYASPTGAAVAAGVLVLAAAAVLMSRRAPTAARPALGAALTGVVLVGMVLAFSEEGKRGSACRHGRTVDRLASLPRDAVIAGDPGDLMCLPVTARRAVVTSTQLAPSYEEQYFRRGRARMFATLRAVYGPSPDAIAELQRRYGATHLWVRRGAIEQELGPGGRRWRARQQPYGAFVRRLLAGGRPAALHLPVACRAWHNGGDELYDIACVAGAVQRRAAAPRR